MHIGHGAGDDGKVPYTKTAVLNLDPKLTVREKVDTSQNSDAQINISGGKYDTAKTSKFCGKVHTVLTLSQSTITDAVVENIGGLVLKDGACLQSSTDELQNITLQSSFVLSEKSIENGYKLNYENGVWSVNKEEVSFIGDIQIFSAPEKVDLRKIQETADGMVPDQNVFLEAVWYDSEGTQFTSDEVEEYALYEMDYVIKIKTEYLEE